MPRQTDPRFLASSPSRVDCRPIERGRTVHEFWRTFFDWHQMRLVLPDLLTEGLGNTLLIASLAVVLGVVLGMVLAFMLLSTRLVVRVPARLYVEAFRGLPAIVT